MKNIKYLVFDLDDTLLRKNRAISSYTLSVLKKAQEKGYKIVFNTSRSKENSLPYIEQVNPDFGIYNGGCQIVDKSQNILFSLSIDKDTVKRLTTYLYQYVPKLSVQSLTSFYASDKDYKAQNAIWHDFKNGLEAEAYKILCFTFDFAFIKEVADKYNLDYQNYLNSGWHRLSKKGANKLKGMKNLLKLTGDTLENVCYFGDDFGDKDLIINAGIGVAMANSKKEVLEAASFVCPTNEEDGCVKFISDNIL